MSKFSNTIKSVAVAGIGALAFTAASPSNAAMILELDDLGIPGVEVSVTDNGPGDLTPADVGLIIFNGAVGPNYTVNISIGESKPLIGPPSSLELTSINVATSTPSGALSITLTDTDFFDPNVGPIDPLTIFGSVGGVLTAPAGSTLEVLAILDLTNSEFGVDVGSLSALGPVSGVSASQVIATLGQFGPGAFSNNFSAATPITTLVNPFSLTLVSTVNLTGPGTISFNAITGATVAVPEPATLSLMGAGLLGLGATALRRRRRKAQ